VSATEPTRAAAAESTLALTALALTALLSV
jgi:hypothetical protein